MLCLFLLKLKLYREKCKISKDESKRSCSKTYLWDAYSMLRCSISWKQVIFFFSTLPVIPSIRYQTYISSDYINEQSVHISKALSISISKDLSCNQCKLHKLCEVKQYNKENQTCLLYLDISRYLNWALHFLHLKTEDLNGARLPKKIKKKRKKARNA